MKLSHQQLCKLSLVSVFCFAGIQKVDELAEFLSIVHEAEPKRILEIGRWTGGMLWALAQVAPDDAVLVSVENGEYDLTHVELKQEGIGRPGQRVEFIDGDSHAHETLYKVIDAVGGERFDLVFIDGDHSYAGVKEDWVMYSPLVRMGGLVAFHDIAEHPTNFECEVDQLWSQLRDRLPTREILAKELEDNTCGIGVLEITPDVVNLRAREAFK